MRRLLAALALSLALAAGLVPGFALAADGVGLTAGMAELETQDSEWGWVAVEDGPTFYGTPQTITMKGLTKACKGGSGKNAGRFALYKDGSLLYQEDVAFTSGEWMVKDPVVWTCELTELGDYTVKFYHIYDWRDGWGYQRVGDIFEETFTVSEKIPMADAKVTLTEASAAYSGKKILPSVESVSLGGKVLEEGTDYTVSAETGRGAGSYKVTVTGEGVYEGTAAATFKITKAANKLAKTKVSKTLKAKSLKKKAATVALPKAKFGKVAWKVSKNNAKKVLSLTKAGKVKVKKGAKKGTYTIKLKANVKGTANYKAVKNKLVTVKVKVK